jgi:hypothetical protein
MPSTIDVFWSYEIKDMTTSSFAIANDKLYIGSGDYDYCIYCLDAETGEKIWGYKKDLLPWISSLVVANGKIYDASFSIYCVSPKEDTTPLYFISVLLLLVLFFAGLFLWKKRRIVLGRQNIKLIHKLMILIGIFSVISALSPSPIIFYGSLIIVSSLTVLLFLIEKFWQSIISLFFSFFIPSSISSFILTTIMISYPINEAEALGMALSIVIIPSVTYLLLVLLSSISLLLSNRGKSRVIIVISSFLFFFVLFLISIYISKESPSDVSVVFIPFMLIVPTTVYFAYGKILQWKEEEKGSSKKKRKN